MSITGMIFRIICSMGDKKRDVNLTIPQDVTVHKDISYAPGGRYHLLDVSLLSGSEGKVPVIVSIHGGGYVYGVKEAYQYYAAYLAQQGFAVVNFNYQLAPKAKFPTQLQEVNQVMEWIVENAAEYHMDLKNIFLVGDSAGAQMASHYAAIYSNPRFEKLFPLRTPKEIKIKAVALNCGMYDLVGCAGQKPLQGQLNMNELMQDYLGKGWSVEDKRVHVLDYITEAFPPAFIMTAQYDFLKGNARPMQQFLTERGIPCEYRLYGKEGQEYMGHVFHIDMNLEEAKQCNREECDFFRRYVGE